MVHSQGGGPTPDEAAWVAAALVVVVCLGGAVMLAEWPLLGTSFDSPEERPMVEPTENGTELWPYTSKRTAFDGRTLGINVVFFGDQADVRTALVRRSELEWEEETEESQEADEESVTLQRVEYDPEADGIDAIRWDDAEGSDRYAYVEADGEGRWIEESYQLHSGTYLGHRDHIRAYEDPQGEWTALQAHDEHWDWFRLRHTVTGVSETQRDLEEDFMHQRYVDGVVRLPFENAAADGDGWATGITLAGVGGPFVVFAIAGRGRAARRAVTRFASRHRRELALGASLFALYTGVRWLGILGEYLAADLTPKAVAAPLYVAMVVGTPAVAYAFGRRSDTTWAFTFAALGLGGAFVVDFAAMQVSVVPLRVILHRVAVVLVVGLVALGAAHVDADERWPFPLQFGLAGWVAALALPLFGYL